MSEMEPLDLVTVETIVKDHLFNEKSQVQKVIDIIMDEMDTVIDDHKTGLDPIDIEDSLMMVIFDNSNIGLDRSVDIAQDVLEKMGIE